MKVSDLSPADFDTADLAVIEEQIRHAQLTGSIDHLTVLGFGEVSVAVGWPQANPTAVVKRLPPGSSAAGAEADLDAIRSFMRRVESRGGFVVPTALHTFSREDDAKVVPYLIQPAIPAELMAETVLANEPARVDHPMLVALYNFVTTVSTDDGTVDPQLANFAWDGEHLALFDLSTPMTWDATGKSTSRLESVTHALPAPLKPVARKAITDVMEYYRGPLNSLTQTCVFLKRMGLDDWAHAASETFNARLHEKIDPAEVATRYQRQSREFRRIKTLARLHRWWARNVQRQEFEFIITDSFTGEIL